MRFKETLFLILMHLFIPFSVILPQSIVWEKEYFFEELKGSSFRTLLFPAFEESYFYGIGYGIRGDTSFVVIYKIDSNGNLIFFKRHYKIIGGKIKRIFVSDFVKFEKQGAKDYIVSVNFLPIYGSLEYYLGFWMYVMKFDPENGNLVYEGLDTASKHTLTFYPEGPGTILELNNVYYNFSVYKGDTLLLKFFDLDGNFINETKISLSGKLPKDDWTISSAIFIENDSSFILGLNNSCPWFHDCRRSYLLKISKNFDVVWANPLTINNDTLSLLLLQENKDQKIIAMCTKIDTTRYIVELSLDGSLMNLKQLEIDKRIRIITFKQVSDGGYIFLAQFRLTPLTSTDTSIAIFFKTTKGFEVEQVFYHKQEPMPWGSLFKNVYELSDNSFLVTGYYQYYPYLLKLKDVLLAVNEPKNDNLQSIFNQQIVEDCIYLNDYYKVSIYSLYGVKVYENFAQKIIDVTNLSPGVYFLIINSKAFKFVKL